MPEILTDTRAIARQGALGTAAGDTILASIRLPANGPWTIFGIWAMVVQATQVGGDAIVGHFRLNAPSGDLIPNPAPSRFPFAVQPSQLGATVDQQVSPLKIWDVKYTAPGNASIEFIVNQATPNIVAPMAAMGILFGKTIPEEKPITFIDRARAQVSSGAITSVGTITLSENSKMITGLCGMLAQDNVLATAEELMGIFILSSDDLNLQPSEYPFQAGFSAGLGALIMNGGGNMPVFFPVKIPVPAGADIDVSVDLVTAVTNAAEVAVFMAYE